MALPADYITGTITLTNGSTAFTGSGTGWLAADFREGDTLPFIAGGETWAPPIIATITSNTAGTLTRPWAGPSLSGVAYRMRYQWDSSRVSAQTRTMIEQLGNGNLQAEAALTGAANQLSYFTGVATKALTPLTAFARTLIDDTTSADMRSTLGIPTLLASFGVGQTGAPAMITDFNAVTEAGFYAFNSGATNSPPINFTGTLINLHVSATAKTQIAMSATSDSNLWMRRFSGGAWGGWKPVAPQLISTADDLTWRLASGLQICLRTTPFSVPVDTAATGAIFRGSTTWTFGAPFVASSQVNAFSYAGSASRWGGSATGVSTTGCTLYHFAGATSATNSNLYGIAIGRYE